MAQHFADYNSAFCGKRSLFSCYRLRGFTGDDAAWDCQPDYSVHCNVHLSAGVSHARAIWHHVGSAWLPSGVYFRRAFVAAMAFPFFWLLESRSLILMTMGYVLLINIGHNSLNAVQPSFFAGLFHPPVRYSGSSIGAQLGAVVAGDSRRLSLKR